VNWAIISKEVPTVSSKLVKKISAGIIKNPPPAATCNYLLQSSNKNNFSGSVRLTGFILGFES
jgi:hypothetical protein